MLMLKWFPLAVASFDITSFRVASVASDSDLKVALSFRYEQSNNVPVKQDLKYTSESSETTLTFQKNVITTFRINPEDTNKPRREFLRM